MSTTISALAPGATTPTGLADILARIVSVDDYGALHDGRTDDGPAFMRAYQALGADGGRILMGPYRYLVNTPCVFAKVGVALEGVGIPYAFVPGWGTTILTTNFEPGFVPFTFTDAATAALRRFAVCQVHPAPSLVAGIAWAPNPYGFFFVFDALWNGFEIDDVEFGGITRGVSASTCGHFTIKSIFGQFYDVGVQIMNCLDNPRLLWVKSWPYITNNTNVMAYMQANLDLLLLGRVDGIFIGDMHGFCARALIHCVQEAPGAAIAGSPGGMAKIIAGKLSGDQVYTTLWADELSTAGAEGATALWSIAHLDGAPLDATSSNAVPLVGGTVLRINCTGGLNITIADFVSGYTMAESVHVEGDTNTVELLAYRHHTPNFAFAPLPPAMVNVLAPTAPGSYPNVVILGTTRVFNARGAEVFGGSGANPASCRHGLLIVDGQPIVDGLPYAYTPGIGSAAGVTLFSDDGFTQGRPFQMQFGDAGNYHQSQRDQSWNWFAWNGFRWDTAQTKADAVGPLSIGPYGDIVMTKAVSMTGLSRSKPIYPNELWNNGGFVAITS